jgi:hypothetical protein
MNVANTRSAYSGKATAAHAGARRVRMENTTLRKTEAMALGQIGPTARR